MAKLLRSRDRVLLGLAVLGDAADWLMPGRNERLRRIGINLYLPLKYRKPSYYTAVSRMLKTGLISKKIENNEAVWKLTSSGKKQVTRSFPLLEWQNKKWDGWWRLAVFDIESKRNWVRDKLRQKLIELGFGQWQKSVYVSPHDVTEDIKEFLETEKLAGQVSVLECRELWPDNPEKIERMWQLNRLNQQYESLVDYFKKHKLKNGKKEMHNLVSGYLRVIVADPFLPKEFLPQPWFGSQARKVISSLHF